MSNAGSKGERVRECGPPDGERRRAKLTALYMPDGTYTDPHVELYFGFDVIVTDDGRVRDVYGFSDAIAGS